MIDVNVNVSYYAAVVNAQAVNTAKEPMSESWGIQVLADRFDITPRAIRFYEDKGLLSPRRESGVRAFDGADVARLERILLAKRLGFTLDDIKTVMDVMDGLVRDRTELKERKQNFEKVIKSLKRRHQDIESLVGEMSELCNLIDDHLNTTEDEDGVFYLARAYQAAFGDEFADDDMASGQTRKE